MSRIPGPVTAGASAWVAPIRRKDDRLGVLRALSPRLWAVVYIPLVFMSPGAPSGSRASMTLSWTAPGDDSTLGQAAAYDLRYARTTITAASFPSAVRAPTPAPQPAGATETVLVPGLLADVPYWFALRTIDDAGNTSGISNVIETTARVQGTRAAGYRMRGRDAWGYTFNVTLRSGPGTSSEPTPRPPGRPDTVWLAFMSPWVRADPEGCDYRLTAIWEDGTESAPFAAWRIAAVLPDTDVYLREDRPQRAPDLGGVRIGQWSLAPSDTTWWELAEQPVILERYRARSCELFGYWVRDGRRWPCP